MFSERQNMKVNIADITNRKTVQKNVQKVFVDSILASGTSILFLAVSDWISNITEIACQSTDRKAISFFFSLCTVQVGIFYFIYHLQIAVGIPESQFAFTKLMNEKNILLVLCLLFLKAVHLGLWHTGHH